MYIIYIIYYILGVKNMKLLPNNSQIDAAVTRDGDVLSSEYLK